MSRFNWIGGVAWLMKEKDYGMKAIEDVMGEVKRERYLTESELDERTERALVSFRQAMENVVADARPLSTPCQGDFKAAFTEYEDALTAVVEARLVGLDDKSILNAQANKKLEQCRADLYSMVFMEKEKEE